MFRITKEDAVERRRNQRFSLVGTSQFQISNTPRFGGSLFSDISEGGIRLTVNEFVPLNTEIILQIQLDPERMVECMGKVVWIEENPFLESYQVGIEFADNVSYINSRKDIYRFLHLLRV